jgi:hypothetical protein
MSDIVRIVFAWGIPVSVLRVRVQNEIPFRHKHKTLLGCVVSHEVLSKRRWLVLLGIVPRVAFYCLLHTSPSLIGSSSLIS